MKTYDTLYKSTGNIRSLFLIDDTHRFSKNCLKKKNVIGNRPIIGTIVLQFIIVKYRL